MKRPFELLVSALLTSCLCACNFPGAVTPSGVNPGEVATQVVMTLAVFTQSAQPEPLSSPTLEPLSSTTRTQPTNTITVALTPTFTPMLAYMLTQTLTLKPTDTPLPKPGSIAGAITGYPFGNLPSLAIVAFGQERPYNHSYLITNPGDSSYSMSTIYLIPGQFQVVAYDSSNHSGGCAALITVISEQTVTCDITNWGAGYPPKPSDIPNP